MDMQMSVKEKVKTVKLKGQILKIIVREKSYKIQKKGKVFLCGLQCVCVYVWGKERGFSQNFNYLKCINRRL